MIHVEAGEGGMTLEQVNYIFVHEQQVFLINQQQFTGNINSMSNTEELFHSQARKHADKTSDLYLKNNIFLNSKIL